ncbi:hypothetical protein E3N88_40079 [Mikania micrantha]|uniref:Senescence domain-containing protein n=1 Tax=Mikania micrantha TaxID=192012 RepID=A0A5N6LLL8_9ASTR|nr:hypothetical protein E3N88_40079 [Mikania micrantha]
MRLFKIPDRRILCHPNVTTTQGQHSLHFSSLSVRETSSPITKPKHYPIVTPMSLHKSITSSQWHFVEQMADTLTPTTISIALYNLRTSPALVLKFTQFFSPNNTNLECYCLSIAIICQLQSPKLPLQFIKTVLSSSRFSCNDLFDGLYNTRERLGILNSVMFDMWIKGFCELKRADEAIKWFYLMIRKGVLPKIETCNSMLSLFVRMNFTESAWVLYAEMFRLKISASTYTYNIMINLLCKEGKLKKAKEFVANMEALGLKPNVVTYNTIINGYCMKRDLDGAQRVFGKMKVKGIRPDTYSFGALVSGMCKEGRFNEASALLCKMEECGLVPTAITYNTLIDGYCNRGNLEMAFHYKNEMVKKAIHASVSTYNSLIHALFFEGKESEAEDMIEEMEKEQLVPDAVTYNILINGYCRSGNAQKAFSLHDEMINKGIQPTHVTYTSLINVLNKRNRMIEADNLFAKIIDRGVVPDIVMFNALIDGHCANKNMKRAVFLLKEMDGRKVFPDEVTYNTLMQGYCREGDVEEAIKVFDEMKKRGIKPDYISFNTLISGYSRRGDMKEALMVKDAMLSSGFNPTLLTYNALIQGLCKNKEGHIAQVLFKEMVSKGISPDNRIGIEANFGDFQGHTIKMEIINFFGCRSGHFDQAADVAKTAANSISELQNEFEDSESSKDDLPEASDKDQESEDEDDKKRKPALERLEKASEDTFLGQGIKAIDTSVENFASGAWLALGNAWKGGSSFVQKLEDSMQQGGILAASSVLETGRAFTAKGIQVLEYVGKETMDLLITESGMGTDKSARESGHETEEDQFLEVIFDICFYIYEGPEQLEATLHLMPPTGDLICSMSQRYKRIIVIHLIHHPSSPATHTSPFTSSPSTHPSSAHGSLQSRRPLGENRRTIPGRTKSMNKLPSQGGISSPGWIPA